jgi:2-oxoglutarate dehydrogenase E2 component (dihydrolipoamide succinyltransferase)
MELRKTHGDAFAKTHGIKLVFMSAFVKASAYALSEQPTVNAVIDGCEIVYRDYIAISVAVAVATPKVMPLSSKITTSFLSLFIILFFLD